MVHADGSVELRVRDGAPATLETVRLSRDGGGGVASRAGPLRLGGEAVRFDRGAAVEEIAARGRTLEQSWSFDRRPSGTGDLVARVRWRRENAAVLRASEDGAVHVSGGAQREGYRYSAATWRDARGHELSVPGRVDGDTIELRVPRQAVDDAVYPAVLDPVVSPETALDDTPRASAAFGAMTPAIAAGPAGETLTVWENLKGPRIVAARVSTSGTVLGLVPALTPTNATPAVDYDGTSYLVAWCTGSAVEAKRVSAAGAIVDVSPIPVASGGCSTTPPPALAFDGANHVVVFANGSGVVAVRVSPTGAVLDANPVLVASPPADNDIAQGTVASRGDGTSVVTWVASQSLRAAAMTDGSSLSVGAAADLGPFGYASAATTFSGIATDGTNYLVTFVDTNGAPAFRRLGPTAAALDSGPTELASESTPIWPVVSFDGSAYVTAWLNPFSSEVHARHVATDGSLEGPGPVSTLVSSPLQTSVALAGSSGTTLVLESTREMLLAGRLLSSDATPDGMNGFLVATEPAPQSVGDASHGTTATLVSWEELQTTSLHTFVDSAFARRIRDDGVVLDSPPITIESSTTDYTGRPFLAWNGMHWLAVMNYPTLHARLVDADGSVGASIGLPAQQASYPSVASNGTDFLVTWQEGTDGAARVAAARVSGAGALVDTSAIAVNASYGQQPHAGFNGTSWFIAWTDAYGGRAARVGTNGVVLDPAGIPFFSQASVRSVTCAAGACTALLYDYGQGIKTARIDAAGTLTAKTLAAAQVIPVVSASDGASIAVLGPSVQQSYGLSFGLLDAVGATVVYPGTPLIAPDGPPTRDAASAAVRPGVALVAYTVTNADEIDRAMWRTISWTTKGGTCTSADECTTGSCVDGVCCDSPCAGACAACTSAKKGGGADGVCGPIAAGLDPDDECAVDPGYPATCGPDGTCDGAGACRAHAVPGTACATPSCAAAAVLRHACDDDGGCAASSETCDAGCSDGGCVGAIEHDAGAVREAGVDGGGREPEAGLDASGDAASDADDGSGGSGADAAESGCSCRLGGAVDRGDRAIAAALPLVGVIAVARRRRRRRPAAERWTSPRNPA